MKRICIITQCSLPVPATHGGAVETLAEYLINENEKNPKYTFTIVAIKDDHSIELAKKYKHTRFIFIDSKIPGCLDKCWYLVYRILKHIHIYVPFSGTFFNALKTVKNLEKHDLYLFLAGPTTQIPVLAKIIESERLLVHLHWDGMGKPCYAANCREVIAISKYIAGQWINKTGSSKVTVVENCVNLETFNKKITESEKVQLREKLNIRDSDKVVLFVGRIDETKGIRELIHAFDSIEDSNTVLLVIGSSNFGIKTNTPYEREVKKLIENSAKRIIFTGYVHQSELYKYYSLATCSVMPSQSQEPAGLVAIEAQATGTPLIATNVGGLSEYCSGKSSILVEKDENQVHHLKKAIEFLLNNPDVCITMSKNGRDFAQTFNTKRYFNNFSTVFDKTLDELEDKSQI